MVATYLFACVHNAGRSQMAAAWFNHLVDPSEAQAISAGTQPENHLHPEVVNAMAEIGIDLPGSIPRKLTEELARDATLLVTTGRDESSPSIPGLRTDDWPVENPKGKRLETVRAIRDEVKERVLALVKEDGLKLKSSQ